MKKDVLSNQFTFIDVFSGAGGLSEGFTRAGFTGLAHIEADSSAAYTLKTRLAREYLHQSGKGKIYESYLKKEIERSELWQNVPSELLESVINRVIDRESVSEIKRSITVNTQGKKIDVLIGGPPCQAYSLVGRSRDPNRMVGDSRNYLFRLYAEFLKTFKPKFFVFENVLGLLSAGSKAYLNEMVSLFESSGYSVDHSVLAAEDFGVLQRRKRVIVIGRRGRRRFLFPKLKKLEGDWQTKRDIFADLPILPPGGVNELAAYTRPPSKYLSETGIRNGGTFTTQHVCRPHNERDLEIYAITIEKWLSEGKRLKYDELPQRLRTHNNISGFLDRFKVIDPNGLSHTVVAHIAKDGHYYIYPDSNQVRSISVREAARIQSFPDDYFFEGGRTAAFRQIGNAVPPLMARAIADYLKSELS